MVKVTNIFGDKYSGQAGKAGVFATWKGRQYRREYVIPSNPNTTMQQAIRGSFTNAVDGWHVFLSLMRKAYGYMATGLVMSGFNLYVSRWQKMTADERAAYVKPHIGFKQIGSNDLTATTQWTIDAAEKQLTEAERNLGLGQAEAAVGTGDLDCNAIVDVKRGRVNIPTNRTGAMTISYTSLGRTITDEALKTDPQAGDVLYTDYFPIDYKSTTVKLATTTVDSLEVDTEEGNFFLPNYDAGNDGGTVDSKYYTPITSVKLETKKVDTSFVTWRGYTGSHGVIESAQTSEDGNRDSRLEKSGYQPKIKANLSALDAAKDEYIKLVST